MGSKHNMWVKVNPDYEILFRSMIGLRPDTERLYRIREQVAEVDMVDIREVIEQVVTEVKIGFPIPHSTLKGAEEDVQDGVTLYNRDRPARTW